MTESPCHDGMIHAGGLLPAPEGFLYPQRLSTPVFSAINAVGDLTGNASRPWLAGTSWPRRGRGCVPLADYTGCEILTSSRAHWAATAVLERQAAYAAGGDLPGRCAHWQARNLTRTGAREATWSVQ